MKKIAVFFLSLIGRAFASPKLGLYRLSCFTGAAIRHGFWKTRLAQLGNNSIIYPHCIIHSPSNVKIGSSSAIGEFVHIWGGGGLEIGDRVMIASHCVITTQTHDANAEMPSLTLLKKGIFIADDAWLGAGAVILPGIRIGKSAVVGAGSVVTKDVPDHAIAVGVPAKIIKQRNAN